MAHTGPRLRSEFSSPKLKQSRPRMTVEADAPIAVAARRHAFIIASTRLS